MSRRIGIAALIWALGTLLSRFIGLGREAAFGRIVGGGQAADIYVAAFTLPNFLNYLLAAGALSIVFIPLFAEHLAKGNEDKAWETFSVISTAVALMLTVATGLLWLAVPSIDAWMYAGFPDEARIQLDAMTRVLLPAQIFHVLGGLLSAALQARDRHFLPAMTSVVYNASIILGGLIGGAEHGAWGFVWGVLVGSVLGPFGLPLIGCLRMGLRYRFMLRWTQDLKAYLWRSLPIMLGFSVVVVDDWLLMSNGANLEEGSVATLMYAKNLLRVPMGVFGLALGAAAYPTLSRLIAENRAQDAYRTLEISTARMLILALGAQIALTASGTEIAAVIYGQRLLPGQHEAIGVALGIFGLGLWAWAAQTVLARGFYAKGQTWIPTALGTAVIAILWPLYTWLGAAYGTIGLASASTIAISVYVFTLVVALRRSFAPARDGLGAFALRAAPTVAVGLVVAIGARWALHLWYPPGITGWVASVGAQAGLPSAATVGALVQGSVLTILALSVYGGTSFILKVLGFKDTLNLLTRRMRRRPVAP
jgi:putative peptidoglycan lipid II flippase